MRTFELTLCAAFYLPHGSHVIKRLEISQNSLGTFLGNVRISRHLERARTPPRVGHVWKFTRRSWIYLHATLSKSIFKNTLARFSRDVILFPVGDYFFYALALHSTARLCVRPDDWETIFVSGSRREVQSSFGFVHVSFCEFSLFAACNL